LWHTRHRYLGGTLNFRFGLGGVGSTATSSVAGSLATSPSIAATDVETAASVCVDAAADDVDAMPY
jgi:hypothetical protein